MDIVQNGESSNSNLKIAPVHLEDTGGIVDRDAEMLDGDVKMEEGVANGVVKVDDDAAEKKRGTARLIMPAWDIPPQKSVHPSQDLLSLLHLDTLYNAYVRPFADDPGGEAGDLDIGAQGTKRKGQMRKKMEKGYQHLIEDCIDPTPLGIKTEHGSLKALLTDVYNPGLPPPLPPGPLDDLPKDLFKNARLETGLIQDGYIGGEKAGVREAEEKRKRKRAAKTAPPTETQTPTNGTFLPNGRSSSPGTPLLPVPPPVRGYPRPPQRGTAPPGAAPFSRLGSGVSGFPSTPQGLGGRPIVPSSKQRPSSAELPPGYGQNNKKIGSRSASPMPFPSSATPGGGGGQGLPGIPGSQRQFPPNRNKRPGSADVGGQVKRPKGDSRPSSPMVGRMN